MPPTDDPRSAVALLRMIFLGALLGIGGLYWYSGKKINPEDFALRREDLRAQENWNGKQITAASLPEMQRILKGIGGESDNVVLWLGNSQLHTINQPQANDHLAPYWLLCHHRMYEADRPLPYVIDIGRIQGS